MRTVGWIQGWFTGTDNSTPELGRLLWALSVLAIIFYQGWELIVDKKDFDAIEFGTGIAAILAAGGFGIAAKDRSHPGNRPTQINAENANVSANMVNVDH